MLKYIIKDKTSNNWISNENGLNWISFPSHARRFDSMTDALIFANCLGIMMQIKAEPFVV